MEQSGREFRVFSERYGYRSVREAIQRERLDNGTRNRLWSRISRLMPIRRDMIGLGGFGRASGEEPLYPPRLRKFIVRYYDEYLEKPTDEIPDYSSLVGNLRESVLKGEWYQVFDIIEYLIRYYEFSSVEDKKAFAQVINGVLTECKTGYRVVGEYIAPIIDEAEIITIEEAIQSSTDPVSQHLQQALAHMADRQNPDYRNSIKESISSVEAIVRITQGNKGTLGKLIDSLGLHPHLAEAFKKLYHYTSDEEGIRHSFFSGDQKVDFDEAKLMLVLCSAFVNYVRTKQSRIQQSDKSEANPGP